MTDRKVNLSLTLAEVEELNRLVCTVGCLREAQIGGQGSAWFPTDLDGLHIPNITAERDLANAWHHRLVRILNP